MTALAKLLSTVLLLAALFSPHAALAQEPSVLVTSSGQALDAFTIKTLLTRAGVENIYDPVATAEQLEGIETLIIAVGASTKGFGAAGITAQTELERTQALIDAAAAADIKLIAVHIGGPERRGGLSEQFVQLVANAADALVVYGPGDEDGFFKALSEQRQIPLSIVEQPMKAGEAVMEHLAAP